MRPEGGEIITKEEMNGKIEDERLEFREEQAQTVRKNEGGKQGLAALALFCGIIVGECQLKRKENQDVHQLTELATLKINEINKIKELYKVMGNLLNLKRESN